jgi:hypothetical protein
LLLFDESGFRGFGAMFSRPRGILCPIKIGL